MRTLQTPRLLLREYAPDDVDALFEIQGDREHMRHTHWSPTRDDCAAWLQAYRDFEPEAGFAPWTVVRKADGRVVGWGGLNVDPQAPEWGPEVTYFVHRDCQGRGYTTELVRAALWYAFSEVRLPSVGAFAMPGNLASARVLAKCGFERLRYEPRLERDHHEIAEPRWQRWPGRGEPPLRPA